MFDLLDFIWCSTLGQMFLAAMVVTVATIIVTIGLGIALVSCMVLS
jgi:hypothetical protein